MVPNLFQNSTEVCYLMTEEPGCPMITLNPIDHAHLATTTPDYTVAYELSCVTRPQEAGCKDGT